MTCPRFRLTLTGADRRPRAAPARCSSGARAETSWPSCRPTRPRSCSGSPRRSASTRSSSSRAETSASSSGPRPRARCWCVPRARIDGALVTHPPLPARDRHEQRTSAHLRPRDGLQGAGGQQAQAAHPVRRLEPGEQVRLRVRGPPDHHLPAHGPHARPGQDQGLPTQRHGASPAHSFPLHEWHITDSQIRGSLEGRAATWTPSCRSTWAARRSCCTT